MLTLHSMNGVSMMGEEEIDLPSPQRQVWVKGLGDFWGDAMATAILSMCYLAGGWAGFSAERLRDELESAAREDFIARNCLLQNDRELERVRRERVKLVFFSIVTLGLWEIFSEKPWPEPRLLPVIVPRVLPAPYSPLGLDWLQKHGYIRRAEMDGRVYIFPEPKLARETRWLWDPLADD